ncbi:hypothetical protein OPV22_022370 [Ensete ventricosum]|uniref:HNH nuclease domain-containing protein n=1 Tax=Ensete ventricosum TaxID=4639 RepID=A0AAV8QPR3_ENSVE|nr:hypothetical protein OPV22_022370 [Ensete ventricosum]
MGTPSPPRPRRESDEDGGKERDRPRFFDAKAKALCWQKAEVVPGRHPERWRKDPAGNVVCKRFWNCLGCICYEYDHIIPFSKGGDTTAENCQILQTRVNRLKSDKQLVDKADLEGFSCDVKFTDKELDIIEMATYGDVIRPGNQCQKPMNCHHECLIHPVKIFIFYWDMHDLCDPLRSLSLSELVWCSSKKKA